MKTLIQIFAIILSAHLTTLGGPDFKTFHVEVIGQGRPVIFLPGLGCSAEVWQSVANSLKNEFQCHLITPAGFAGSTINGNYNYQELINEIKTYIKNNGLVNSILIGHSFGGFLSLIIASQMEESYLSKVIILDSYPFYLYNLSPSMTQKKAEAQANLVGQTLLSFNDSIYQKQHELILTKQVNTGIAYKRVLNWILNTPRALYVSGMEFMLSQDIRDKLSSINAEMYIIGAFHQDVKLTYNKVYDHMASQYHNVKALTIKVIESKHFIMFDQPELLISILNTFISKGA